MKANNIYKISAFLLGIVVMFGCVKWEEFKPSDLAAAPNSAIAESVIADSSITVTVTNTSNGFATAILLEGSGNDIPEDPEALLKGNVVYDAMLSGELVANEPGVFTFSGLMQNTTYEVMAVTANADGVPSAVSVLEVTTTDSWSPVLLGGTPAFGYSAVVEKGTDVSLSFNEAVKLGTGTFTLEGFYTGTSVTATAAVSAADPSVVNITVPADFPDREYIWLHYTEGAVLDLMDNPVAALTTYFDGDAGAFVGAFWRLVSVVKDATVAPDAAVEQTPGFDIVLTFDDDVDVDDVADGDITLTYDDGAGIVTAVDVPAADVSAVGGVVTIVQTVFTATSGTVSIDIPEGVFGVGIGNPSAAIMATWTLVAPL